MTKILLIAIAFAAGFWLLRNHRRRADRDASLPETKAENMVVCAHCGVHMPRGESLSSETRFFCSLEHEQEFHRKR